MRYETRDLYFAAYLKVAAVPLLGVERDGGLATFVFEDQGSSMMRKLKHEYFSDRAQVNALSYAQAVQELKRSIYHSGS